jgi:hypothetical protein
MSWKRRVLPVLAAALVFGLLVAVFPAEAQVVNEQFVSSGNSGTSLTCVLAQGVSPYDVAVVAISSTTSVSSVADSSGDTYTAQSSAAAPGGSTTEGAFAYLYTATLTAVPVTHSSLTITVTFSSSTQGGIACYDLVGYGATAAHESTGTGTETLNGTSSFTSSVTSFTPTAGDFVVSVVAGSVCNSLSSVTTPSLKAPTTSQGYTLSYNSGALRTNPGVGGLQCSYAGSHPPTGTYYFATVGEATWNLTATGHATTQPYTIGGTQGIEGTHTINPAANWAEAAMDLPLNVVVSKAVTDTFALTVHNALKNPAITETFGLVAKEAQGNPVLSETFGLTPHNAQAAPSLKEGWSLCYYIYNNNVNTIYACNQFVVFNVVATVLQVVQPNPATIDFWIFPLITVAVFAMLFLVTATRAGATTWARNYMLITGLVVGMLMAVITETMPFPVLLLGVVLWFYYAYRG